MELPSDYPPSEGRWTPKRPVLRRILWYRERIVHHGGFTLAEALDALEIHERTFHRDMAYLRTLHWDLDFNRRTLRWETGDGLAPLPLATVGEGEMLALLVAEQALRSYAGTPYGELVHQALHKLIDFFDAPLTVDLNQPFVPVVGGPPVRRVQTQQYLRLFAACRECRRLELEYYSADRGEWTTRRVDPYRLWLYGGDPYLIAYDHRRGKPLTFALGERMRSIRDTGETFELDPEFDLDAFLASGFGLFQGGPVEDVVLHFSSRVAHFLNERAWHESESKTSLPHGGLELRMRVPVNIGLLRFILQYGPDVTVVEPASLRADVAGLLRKALEGYGD